MFNHDFRNNPPKPCAKPACTSPNRRLVYIFFAKNFCVLQSFCIFVKYFGIVVMTEKEKQLLSTFEARLRHLIYLHDELKRESTELKQLLAAKETEVQSLKEQLEQLNTDYTNLKSATAISLNGGDVKETKLRLSSLVREVDKCIALLDE